MAKDNQDIDRLFRDKLGGHLAQPSPLAWNQLENRLSRTKKGAALWMRIAASLLLLGGLAALLWLSVENAQKKPVILAEQEPLQETIPQEVPEVKEPAVVKDRIEEDIMAVKKAPVRKASVNSEKAQLEVARMEETEPVAKELVPVQELDLVELPPLDMDLLVVENSLVEPTEAVYQEVAYKVTIISNGLREKPEKDGLVGEIENKIDKIGGLIGKVDQGFADLQDAKNNLFASITTRK